MKISERIRQAAQERRAGLGFDVVYGATQKHLTSLSPQKWKALWASIGKEITKEANQLLGAFAKNPDTKKKLRIMIEAFTKWSHDATTNVINGALTKAIKEKGDALAQELDQLYGQALDYNQRFK